MHPRRIETSVRFTPLRRALLACSAACRRPHRVHRFIIRKTTNDFDLRGSPFFLSKISKKRVAQMSRFDIIISRIFVFFVAVVGLKTQDV